MKKKNYVYRIYGEFPREFYPLIATGSGLFSSFKEVCDFIRCHYPERYRADVILDNKVWFLTKNLNVRGRL